MSKLDKETLDAITAAVAEAVQPLRAELRRVSGGQQVAAAAIARTGQAKEVPETTMCILASKGLSIPFDKNGSIPTHKLLGAMKEAGLSAHNQTYVKISLLTAGHVFVP